MKSFTVWALVGLNVLLLAMVIGSLTPRNAAVAQVPRPADYLMIPAEVPGGNTGVVYVLDMSNQMLGAMAYDDATKKISFLPRPIDLNSVFRNQ